MRQKSQQIRMPEFSNVFGRLYSVLIWKENNVNKASFLNCSHFPDLIRLHEKLLRRETRQGRVKDQESRTNPVSQKRNPRGGAEHDETPTAH